MRPILAWCGITAALLLAALFIKSLPDDVEGAGLTAVLFLVTALLMVKVCRGSP
jgi:hypothetical protein